MIIDILRLIVKEVDPCEDSPYVYSKDMRGTIAPRLEKGTRPPRSTWRS